MGDIKSAEAFVDVVFITATGGTTGVSGLTPTCYSVKAADNTRTACVVASLGSGWYTATVTPDADGTWMTEWAISGAYTVHYPYKMFKVGGGELADALTDTAELQEDWTDGGRLDLLLDAIKAKTDNLPSDPADDSDLDTAIADIEGKVDDLETRLSAARAGYLDNINNANLATLPAITSARIAYLDNISVGAVALDSTVAKETTLTHATYGLDKIKTDTAAIKAKTDIIGASVALESGGNLASVLADTNELQTDWANGGRLDLLLDAVKAETDKIANGTYGLSALNTKIGVVDGYFDVPTADTTNDVTVRDVVGRKTDTANTTVGATSSIMRYIKGLVENIPQNAASTVSHSITTANDTTETTVHEVEETGIYQLSIFTDLDSLETAGEGGTVTFKLYNKIDGSNYSDIPSAHVDYVVGAETEYPSFEVNLISGYTKLTVECSSDVTATRTVPCKIVTSIKKTA